MPYIQKGRRTALAPVIESVPQSLTRGELNYLITSILLKSMAETSYTELEAAIGTLEMVKLEFYRRMAVPYETAKKMTNGEVYPVKHEL